MANWTGGILTDLGRELQAKVEAGTPLKVTCFKLGDGTETVDDAQSMSNLLAPKIKFGITGIERKGTLCTFTGVITSSKVSAGFRAREWGLFADDPDRGEILYMIALDDRPDYIAAQDATLNSTITYALNVDIASTAEISPVIDAAGLVSVDTLDKAAGLVRRSTAYALKDIAYDIQLSNHPSWRLVCTKAGTTGETILNLDGAKLGNVYKDGSAEWTIKDIYAAVIEDHDTNKNAHAAGIAGNAATASKLETARKITLTGKAAGSATFDGSKDIDLEVTKLADGVSIGAIMPYSGNGDIPAGYLLCDGAAVSRTMYPDLFSVIGTTYGAGDGSTTVNLPNLTDKFIEGSNTAGTSKAAGLPNITGGIYTDNGWFYTNAYGAIYFASSETMPKTANDIREGAVNPHSYWELDASRSSSIYGNSKTVQPPALTMRYIIKAFDGATADSALIDITSFANELAGKANRNFDNITDVAKTLIKDTVIKKAFLQPNGYIVFSNGLIIQWQVANSGILTTFPLTFNQIWSCQVTPVHTDIVYPGGGLSVTFNTSQWRVNMKDIYDCRCLAIGI